MADPQVNFFKSTLVGTYSDTDTSLTLATGDGALLPDPSTDGAFNLTIFEGLQVTGSTEFEIVRVTARSGDVLTVTRGQENTTPLTIGSATHSILMSATKKTFDDINDAIANVDLTTLTGVEELTFDSTGDEEFGLPAGTTAQRPSNPSAGYMRYNTETAKLEIYSGGVWGLVSLENVRVMQTAQLSVTANNAVAENVGVEVEYLVIAGGGGGGAYYDGAGGGAGGYRSSVSGESSGGGASAESPLELDLSTNYTVTVGAGGASANDSRGNNGSDSVFSTITSTGGGGGGKFGNADGLNGGSGGGAAMQREGADPTPGSGVSGQGFSGGDCDNDPLSTNDAASAGGGGAGSAGGNGSGAPSPTFDGGSGVSSSITGSSVGRAGGGGGGGIDLSGSATDGGGNGATKPNNGQSGTVNSGGGGGGASDGVNTSGGAGGSGVVILRYPSDYSITIGAGLTGSETTVGANKVATITAGTGNVSWSEA